MLNQLADTLRQNPALAIFLTVGIGYLIGRIKIHSFSLGTVTAVLITGVIVGQLDIPESGPIKTVFFMMFLFSIGYSVGPDFFRSLRGSGARQALFAVLMSLTSFAATIAMALVFSYDQGETIGLFAGSQTCSSLIGIGSDAISRLPLPPQRIKALTDIIPVCYAVTYIFGTLGTVIILGNLGPKILGGLPKVRARAASLEHRLDTATDHPANPKTHRHHHPHTSDITSLCIVLFIGGIAGAASFFIGPIPVSLGTSGGALIAGLLFGWLRSRHPKFGHISPGALWLMNNLGLNVFIAVVGIQAAPTFISGIRSVGPMLLLAGAIATTIPLLTGLWLGHRVFRFNPAITLGCCAGSRTCTAALGAVQESIQSTIPTIGYTVCYAVANILLVIWGTLTVAII